MGAAPSTPAKKWNQIYISEDNGALLFATNVNGKKVIGRNLFNLGRQYITRKRAIVQPGSQVRQAQPGSQVRQAQPVKSKTFLEKYANSRAAATKKASEIAKNRREQITPYVNSAKKGTWNLASEYSKSRAAATKKASEIAKNRKEKITPYINSAKQKTYNFASSTAAAAKEGAAGVGRVSYRLASSAGKTASALGSAAGSVGYQAASSAGKTASALGSAAGRGAYAAGTGIYSLGKSLFTRKSKVAPSPNNKKLDAQKSTNDVKKEREKEIAEMREAAIKRGDVNSFNKFRRDFTNNKPNTNKTRLLNTKASINTNPLVKPESNNPFS